jgi:putative DNA-invertase from lambdoid prophage Rac
MAATAQAQAEATKEAQKAGIAHAKANEPDIYKGHKAELLKEAVTSFLEGGMESVSAIASAAGISRQAVYRIKDNRAGMEAALASWGL